MKTKRIIAVLLVCIMLGSMMPFGAFAEEGKQIETVSATPSPSPSPSPDLKTQNSEKKDEELLIAVEPTDDGKSIEENQPEESKEITDQDSEIKDDVENSEDTEEPEDSADKAEKDAETADPAEEEKNEEAEPEKQEENVEEKPALDDSNSWLVSFRKADGMQLCPDQRVPMDTGIVTKPSDPVVPGEDFKGWYLGIDGTGFYGEVLWGTDGTTIVTENTTFYARFDKLFTVTFNYNDPRIPSELINDTRKNVPYNYSFLANELPDIEYTIKGTDCEGKESEWHFAEWDYSGLPITSDTVITASWIKVEDDSVKESEIDSNEIIEKETESGQNSGEEIAEFTEESPDAEEKAESVKTEEVNETEESAEAEEVSETEEPAEAEEVNETEEPAEAEEVNETEEPAEAEEVNKTEEPAEAEEVNETEEPVKAEEVNETEESVEEEKNEESEEPEEWEYNELNLTEMPFETDESEPVDGIYKLKEGSTEVWVKGSGKEITVISAADISKFICLRIDGNEINTANYSIVSGSTKIIFSEELAESLGEGEHVIEIASEDGTATAILKIVSSEEEKEEVEKKKVSAPANASPELAIAFVIDSTTTPPIGFKLPADENGYVKKPSDTLLKKYIENLGDFEGWYRDSNFVNEVEWDEENRVKITENTVFYAKIVNSSYSVTYSYGSLAGKTDQKGITYTGYIEIVPLGGSTGEIGNGEGKVITPPQAGYISYFDEFNESSGVMTHKVYKFTGWKITSGKDSGKIFSTGDIYKPVESNTTFTAQWTRLRKVTVKFTPSKFAAMGSLAPLSGAYNENGYPLSLGTILRNGDEFYVWEGEPFEFSAGVAGVGYHYVKSIKYDSFEGEVLTQRWQGTLTGAAGDKSLTVTIAQVNAAATGDDFNPLFWTMTTAVSLAGIAMVLIEIRKRSAKKQ